jgi:hypothetical protein
MKHFICLIVIITLFICSAYANVQDLSRYDLSTNEGVAAAREAISGKMLDANSKGCVSRSPDLPKIVVVGAFAYDLGCRFQGVFVGSDYFENESAALSKSALNALGWKTANQEQREKLARLWVEKGFLPFFTVIVQENRDFQNRSFQQPQAISKENGEIIVTLWIRLPPGMLNVRDYQLLEYRFSKDGELLGRATVENLRRAAS